MILNFLNLENALEGHKHLAQGNTLGEHAQTENAL